MKKPFKYYAEFALIPVLFLILVLIGIRDAFLDTLRHIREHRDYYNRPRLTDHERIDRLLMLTQKSE